jgi:TonB family protein
MEKLCPLPEEFRMKHLATVALLGSALGCASGGAATEMAADHSSRHRKAGPAQPTTFESSTGAAQMGLQNEAGVYDSADIEDTMSAHLGEVRGCYDRAGHAQRYAAGKVTLRFKVAGNGTPSDVLVIASDLGNFDVERCLVDVGRRIKFPPPEGRKSTTFEYPVEFRSTEEMKVQDLDDSLKIDRDVAALMHSLAPCGPITESGASALFYIEPNGTVASVGLAADSTLDEQAGACTVKEMRHWKMSATLPGRMLRCRVNIPAVIAAADPPPAKTPVGRKRRR